MKISAKGAVGLLLVGILIYLAWEAVEEVNSVFGEIDDGIKTLTESVTTNLTNLTNSVTAVPGQVADAASDDVSSVWNWVTNLFGGGS